MKESTYCFVDSSNLFYGDVGRLSWKVDYEKLYRYMKKKYKVKKVFYYTGIETHGFEVRLKSTQPYPVDDLLKYLNSLYRRERDSRKKELLKRDIARTKFLVKIQSFGYILRLKPIKHIRTREGTVKSKANCDVDLTFDFMRLEKDYNKVLLLSGDGDFEILLRYLKENQKDFVVIADKEKTARDIKIKYWENFVDFQRVIREIKKWRDRP
jgi:uncharacterized LabA/DUF88 family protein